MTAVSDQHAKGVNKRRRKNKQAKHLHEIANRGWVLKWMGAVLPIEPAAVGAELLDGDLRRCRSHGNALRFYFLVYHDRITLVVFERVPFVICLRYLRCV